MTAVRRIPIIDISSLDTDSADRPSVIDLIAAAARDWGFFQITGHGVSHRLIGQVSGEARAFFALSLETKRGVARTRETTRGYYDRELTKNRRDLKEVFDFGVESDARLLEDGSHRRPSVDGVNRWPDNRPRFRRTMLEYQRACERLSLALVRALCAGLGVHDEALVPHFSPTHTGFTRLNYYPLDDPLEPETAVTVTDLGDMALHHHSDAGALTVLLQDDVGGLQVGAPDVEGWIDVTPTDRALVINLGDMMQIWSNDRYRAALHRVRPITDRPRYSMPFFFNPAYDTKVAPLVATPAKPAKYRPVNWGDFRQARADGDFADYGHEIQIADFRL